MQTIPPISPFLTLLFRRRWTIWGIFAALTLLCLFSARGLVWREDVLDLLPDTDREVRHYREWLSRFRPLDRIYIVIGPADEKQPLSIEDMTAAADSLAQSLAADPEHLLENVTYRTGMDAMTQALDLLRGHRAAYFTEENQAALEKKLQPEAVRRNLENWKRILAGSPAPMLAKVFQRDPVGVETDILEKTQSLQPVGGPFRVYQGRLFSQDLRHVLILAQPRYPSTDGHHAPALVRLVEDAVSDAMAKSKAQNLRAAWLCGHRFALDNAQRIKTDLAKTLSLALAGISLLILLTFSQPLFVLLAIVPAVFGAIFAAGVVRWINPNVSAIAIGCGSMLLGIAVDCGMHILYHADQEQSPAPADAPNGGPPLPGVARILQRMAKPLFSSVATSVVAFMVLLVSVLPGYRDLGLFAALSVAATSAFAAFAMPSVIPLFQRKKRRPPFIRLPAAYPWLLERAARRRGPLLVALAAVSAMAIAGLPKLRFEGDYQKLNAISQETRSDKDYVINVFGEALNVTGLCVRGKTLDEALARNERIAAALARLEKEGIVTGFTTISTLFPSMAVQEANRRRWLAFWTPARVETLKRDLETASSDLRIRAGAFDPFLQELPGDAPPLHADGIASSILRSLFSSHVSLGPDDALVLTNVHLADPVGGLAPLREKLLPEFPDLQTANGPAFMKHMVQLIYRELKRMGLLTLVLVLLFHYLAARSLRGVLLLFLPFVVSIIWTFGLMGWLDIRINMMNSIVTIFIFGIVIDYSIFLFFAWKEGAGDPNVARTSAAVTISALTTCMGMGSLALATHPALRAIGLTALLAITSGWAASLVFAPFAGGAMPHGAKEEHTT